MNYTVSCSGGIGCPPNFTTTDNTTRNYTITNLIVGATYMLSVVGTNSVGSGEAGIASPGNYLYSLCVCPMFCFHAYQPTCFL